MDSYGPETYGERVADLYDDWYQDHPDTEVAVERLAELAGAGPVLELGVGTGRLALPLAERDPGGPRRRRLPGDAGPPARQARR
jgi:methylase of polypeptide subunit release factors